MEQTLDLIQPFDLFSSVTTKSAYMMDVQQKQFCCIKLNDLFLCGFSAEDAQKLGCDFFREIVYSADFPLWADIGEGVLRYLKELEEKWDEIDCFACTFRLKRTFSFLSKPLLQMVCHQIKPVWVDNELRYLICSVDSSTSKEAGNLRLYNKDGLTYSEYNFRTKRWNQKEKVQLTERERAILMLAQQGKSSKEIASYLCREHYTIRNQIKALFFKLEVHSMQEAIEFAENFRMIYSKQNVGSK